MFLSEEQLKESELRFADIQKSQSLSTENGLPNDILAMEGLMINPDPIPQANPATDLQAANRKMTLEYKAPEPTDFAYERAIGKNDSVYSNFVELLMDAKEKVGRILVRKGSNLAGYATGFMVSPRLMLTNWHVFQNATDAQNSEVQFGYEFDITGKEKTATIFSFRPEDFFYSNRDLDYCLVAVSTVSRDSGTNLSKISYLYLDPEKGKLGEEKKESLNIIHHPDGDFKQLSIRENLFTKRTATTILYEADTAQGSSGGPVFNDQWQVVALHHSGVADKNDKGEYIDKYGNPVPYIGGKIQESKINWISNEGIRISVILEDIFNVYPTHELVAQLKTKNETVRESTPVIKSPEIEDSVPVTTANTNFLKADSNDIQISIPSNLLDAGTNISLNLSRNGVKLNGLSQVAPEQVDELSLLEIKKLEQIMDYSGCRGYISKFLGTEIPLPEPNSILKKFIAIPNGSESSELKYHHYSVRHHSVRKMPAISAINVDGSLKLRLDNYKRKDNWIRDNRLDFAIQLDDTYYRNSGFDKGHMSRREDADWGKDADEAKRNADLTCMHTNACPQIGTLNQSSRKGLWGRLELEVLESGAINEGPLTNKISVFNGPVFRDDDPVFRGVQVPMDFYKIILWPTNTGEIRATAFLLSQSRLVKDIRFEQLDIHNNQEFKLYQYPIAKLAEETGLDFTQLIQMDTYVEQTSNKDLASEPEIAAVFNYQ